MQSIRNILKYNFTPPHKQISVIAKKTEVIMSWPKAFEKFCPECADRTMAVSFENGVLTVAALDDSTADAILFGRDRLMEELNTLVGSRVVWWIACEH